MSAILKKGAKGAEVRELQDLLVKKGFDLVIDGDFGPKTFSAVKAFQSQNLDQDGRPLAVDGVVGPLTWWSLRNLKPEGGEVQSVDFTVMPPIDAGGSERGRAALEAAIGQLNANAREIGGNNRGEFVRRYLNGIVEEGNSWCAGFVSWCYSQHPAGIPFNYTVGARDVLNKFRRKGWGYQLEEDNTPEPGDVVCWKREGAAWMGHVGLVYQLIDGKLYTIEGNRSPRVQGFDYVLSRMEKLLGFGRVPDGD